MDKKTILKMIKKYGELTASSAVARHKVDFIDNVKETQQRADDDSTKAVELLRSIATELERDEYD